MPAPSDSILYYPSIEFTSDAWVKASLLVWDRVYRIVPKDYCPRDNYAIREAVDADLVCDIHLEDNDRNETLLDFQRFIDSQPQLPHGLNSHYEAHTLHRDKIDERLYPHLEEVAHQVFGDGRLWLASGLARGYMHYLSLAVARRRNLCRGTDDRDSWSISPYFSENGNFNQTLYQDDAPLFYCSSIIDDVVPLRVATTPMSAITKFVHDRSDEKKQFRESLHSVTESLAKCESKERWEHIKGTFIKGLERKKDQLRRSMDFCNRTDLCSLFAVGMPASITTLSLFGTDPYELVPLSSSLLVGAVAAYASGKLVRKANRPPAMVSYLVDLDETLAREKRIPYFQRSLEEFIND